MLKKIARALLRRRNFIGFDKYQQRGAYHWEEIKNNSDYKALVDAIAAFIKSNDTVLDIGCGDGAYLGYLAKRFHAGWGIDAEAVAIQLAEAKFKERGITNCHVKNLMIDQARSFFASKGQKFDLVWSADVIEHLPRPAELLELAVQVMNPGARAVIGTPLYISNDLVSPYHVKEFKKEEIRDILSSHLLIKDEIIMPHTRKDGNIYTEGYYLASCVARN